MHRARLLGFLLLTIPLPAAAQQSASFRLEEWVFDSGGHPMDGALPGSASFLVTLGAIGDGLSGSPLVYRWGTLTGGFVTSYPLPGEVTNVSFIDSTSLWWSREPSADTYNIYIGDVTTPWDVDYGLCSQAGVPRSLTGTPVTSIPPLGHALFILVTAENVFEEGTKGFDSNKALRPNGTPCP